MAVGSRINVGTAPTAIAHTDSSDGASFVIRNRGTGSVDIGGPSVTAGAGYELLASEVMSADLPYGETLYAIAASGTQRVDVLTVGA